MKKRIGGEAFRRGNKTSRASKLTRRQLGPKQKGVKVGRAKRFIVVQKSLVCVFYLALLLLFCGNVLAIS